MEYDSCYVCKKRCHMFECRQRGYRDTVCYSCGDAIDAERELDSASSDSDFQEDGEEEFPEEDPDIKDDNSEGSGLREEAVPLEKALLGRCRFIRESMSTSNPAMNILDNTLRWMQGEPPQ